MNIFTKITHSIIDNINATITFPSINKILSPSIIILSVIRIIPIIPITAPITNNSMMSSMRPIVNSNTDITLTSPLIRNAKNKSSKASNAIIPIKFMRFEYSWYKKPINIIQVKIRETKG